MTAIRAEAVGSILWVCAGCFGALLGAAPSSAGKHEPGLKEQSLGYRCVMVTKALFWLKLKIFLSFHNIYLQMYVDAALGTELLLQTRITPQIIPGPLVLVLQIPFC